MLYRRPVDVFGEHLGPVAVGDEIELEERLEEMDQDARVRGRGVKFLAESASIAKFRKV
jgi:hypothetical protein